MTSDIELLFSDADACIWTPSLGENVTFYGYLEYRTRMLHMAGSSIDSDDMIISAPLKEYITLTGETRKGVSGIAEGDIITFGNMKYSVSYVKPLVDGIMEIRVVFA